MSDVTVATGPHRRRNTRADRGPARDLPILAAPATGSGAHIKANSFWIFNTLMGATARGTFTLYSLPQAMVAVISLPLVLLLGIVL